MGEGWMDALQWKIDALRRSFGNEESLRFIVGARLPREIGERASERGRWMMGSMKALLTL